MAANATTSSVLPPTTNTLSHSSRARLVRTTRKLEAILGETPFLLESTAQAPAHDSSVPALPLNANPVVKRRIITPTRKTRRQGSIFEICKQPTCWEEVSTPSGVWSFWEPSSTSAESSPRSSEESTRSLPTTLRMANTSFVHLPLVGSDMSDSDSSFSPATRKSRPLGTFRRPRARPPPPRLQLCLPQPAPAPQQSYFSPDTPDMRRDQESDDEDSYPRAPLSPLSPPVNKSAGPVVSKQTTRHVDGVTAPPPASPQTSAKIARAQAIDARMHKLMKLKRYLGENVPPELVFGQRPTLGSEPTRCPNPSLDLSSSLRGHRAMAALDNLPAPRPLAGKRRSASVSVISSTTAFSWMMVDVPIHTVDAERVPMRSKSPAVLREELSWIGEWNLDDMNQVRHGLRTLKAR